MGINLRSWVYLFIITDVREIYKRRGKSEIYQRGKSKIHQKCKKETRKSIKWCIML